MDNILEELIKIGLSKKEAILYMELLSSGSLSVSDLSKHTGIKRTTVHNNSELLIKKGLVSQTNLGNKRMLIAEVPEKLSFVLEKKRWQLNSIERGLPTLIEKMHKEFPFKKHSNQPIIRYYQGQEGFTDVCQRSLDFAEDEILFLSNLEEWYSVYTEEYDVGYYVPTRMKRNIRARILTKKTDKTLEVKRKDKLLKRETRFLPNDFETSTTVLIYGEEVSIMTSSQPYTAIVIENQEVNLTFRSMYNWLWNA